MKPPTYIAQLQHVRELALIGTADLAFWTQKLQPEDLVPAPTEGSARILISGIASRYMGLPFRELIIAIFAAPAEGDERNGAYLVQAFNSSRLLAWSERTFFSTPYVHGQVDVAIGPATSLHVGQAGQVLLRAEFAGRGSESRSPLRTGEELWEGPIYPPSPANVEPTRRKVFFARIGGQTETFSFDPERDSLTLPPHATMPVVGWLVESGFVVQEWAIRSDAHHARSKTYRRAESRQS
jgi:hypothetical protein